MAFTGGFENDDEVMAEINMTPLVDVMLVLLIIFIITMPVITQSINVELPKASVKNASIELKPINITIDANGAIQWQQEAVSLPELSNLLQGIAKQSPQPAIQLQGAAKVPYEKVIEVLALAQISGIDALNFVTQVP